MLTKKTLCCDPQKGSHFVDIDGAQCEGQTFPTSNLQSLSAPSHSVPAGMSDVTSAWISKMSLSCKYHAQVERYLTSSSKQQVAHRSWSVAEAEPGTGGMPTSFRDLMTDDYGLSGRIVCLEDAYAAGGEAGEAARNAFGPMGNYLHFVSAVL